MSLNYASTVRWMARGEGALPSGTQWLTPVEQRRASSMRFTKRRTEYLLRRWTGKCAVAGVLGMPEEPASLGRIAVLNAPTGAPFVQVDGQRLDVDVSLTDRAGWAVCLVGPDLGAVGCDLEIVEPRSDGFVRDFLTPGEQAAVRAAPDREGHDALANLIWSAKESALKVLRTGLRADTRSVEVSVAPVAAPTDPAPTDPAPTDPGWGPLTVATRLGLLPGWWRRDGTFLLTVVYGAGPADPPRRLVGSASLSGAEPIHSWTARPLAD